MINKYYKPSHPNVKIEYSMTPTDQFTSKLNRLLRTGRRAPDIFAMEDAFVRSCIESGLLLDLTDIYEANKDKLLAYPVEIGSYNGRAFLPPFSGKKIPGNRRPRAGADVSFGFAKIS
ncbi:MAG: extracellular solute-binding protein [Treponema sp.]|nr:extracellular solute-binding protein [Treponema sp.]